MFKILMADGLMVGRWEHGRYFRKPNQKTYRKMATVF